MQPETKRHNSREPMVIPHRQMRAIVKKGALVSSTKAEHDGKISAKHQKIRVAAIEDGLVRWAGPGGYWCWTAIENVEF